MSEHIFFYTGLSLFTIHEMDAIRCKEWRIFPGLSFLDDRWGFRIFMLTHIPIFLFIYRQLHDVPTLETFMKGFNVFLMVHMGFHLLYLKHKRNEFTDGISWFCIAGAAICGLADLLNPFF
ncbi:DUF6713 family protein [Sphingobacterium spiritivorum]|uniref:DUF6713 family protein n=1 Tax=Sphingobacterium spiritivorum TaxID=258 RepID=UPI003DA344F1